VAEAERAQGEKPQAGRRHLGTIRMTAESRRGRVVRKNVMIALSKAQGEQIFPVCLGNRGQPFIIKTVDEYQFSLV
jgi:hypothetical protein